MLSLPVAPCSRAHAARTIESLTATHTISSMPWALIASACWIKLGRCFSEQVRVNAPGTAKRTIRLPAKRSEADITRGAPLFSSRSKSLACGTGSPCWMLMLCSLMHVVLGLTSTALETEHLAQVRRGRVRQNGPIDIKGRNSTIAVVSLLHTSSSCLVLIDIDFGIRHTLFIQKPLGNPAITTPGGGIQGHCRRHTLSYWRLLTWSVWISEPL